MKVMNIILIGLLGMLLTACGSNVLSNDRSINIDAGANKRVVVNETIIITGIVNGTTTEVLSYEWKEKDEILATTKTFTYTPTTQGSHLLTFSVQYSDGKIETDNMIVISTSKVIDDNIPKITTALKASYLKAVNDARAVAQNCGSKGLFPAVTALTWNDKLYNASYEHIQDLIASKTFAHNGSGTEADWTGFKLGIKSTQVERAENYKYSWQRLGENLAGGGIMDTANKAVTSWLKSDYHCENLMNPNFKELGMVMLSDEDSLYINYWAQNFGTPK